MVMTKLFCNLISYLKKNIHTYHMFKVAILMLGAHKRAMYNEEYWCAGYPFLGMISTFEVGRGYLDIYRIHSPMVYEPAIIIF